MKEIFVPIQAENFCPDGCVEISPIKTRDERLFCINRDRCKALWKNLKNAEKRAGQAAAPTEGTEAGA